MKHLIHSLAALAMAGAALTATGGAASAVTEHCPDFNSPNKVELDGEITVVQLAPGTEVCYKSGTRVFTTTVGADGLLVSEAYNRNGNRMGISYYIPDAPPPPPV